MNKTQILSTALIRSWESFGSGNGFEYKFIKGVSAFKSGIETRFFNYAYASKEANLDAIQQIVNYFGKIPFTLICEAKLANLEDLNFSFLDSCPGMISTLSHHTQEIGNNLYVTRVRTLDVLEHWIVTVAQGFDVSRDIIEDFARPLIGLDDQRFFIAYLDNEPISACLSSLSEKTTFLAYVATKPNNRRLGAGNAVLDAALTDAHNDGCTHAALHSSKIGESLYKKIGFEDIGNYHFWKQLEAKPDAHLKN